MTASLLCFQQIKSTFLSSSYLLIAFFKDEVKVYQAYVINTCTPNYCNLLPTLHLKHETLNINFFPTSLRVYFCGLGSYLFSVIFLSKAGRFHFYSCMKTKDLFEYSYFFVFSVVECPTKSVCFIESYKMKG